MSASLKRETLWPKPCFNVPFNVSADGVLQMVAGRWCYLSVWPQSMPEHSITPFTVNTLKAF